MKRWSLTTTRDSAETCVAGTICWFPTDIHPCLAALLPLEDVQRNAQIKGRRQALLDAGARLTPQTMGMREPRRGMMQL